MNYLVICLCFYMTDARRVDVPSHLRQRWLSDVHREKEARQKRVVLEPPLSSSELRSKHLSPDANFTVTPNVLGSSAVVTLSWKGVLNATGDDFIGYYCANGTDAEWLDYFMPYSFAPKTFRDGYGSLNMTLYAMRCPLNFRYFHNDSQNAALLVSNSIVFNEAPKGLAAPQAVRIAYGPDETTQIWISFTTDADGSNVPFAALPSGISFNGETSTYRADDLCSAPANQSRWDWWTHVGYFHHILLSGLEPGVETKITFGQRGVNNATTIVKTLPRSSSSSSSSSSSYNGTTFVILADMGIYPAPGSDLIADVLTDWTTKNKMQFVMHIGDISYALGHGFIWDIFHAIIEPISSRVPWMISAGNHEVTSIDSVCWGREGDPSGEKEFWHPSWGNMGAPGAAYHDSNGEGGVPMARRFRTSADAYFDDNGVFWYAIDIPHATILVLSFEHDITPGSRQYRWLTNRLAALDPRNWVLVMVHRPMYNPVIADDDKAVGDHIIDMLEPLFLDYKVSVVFAGHYHSYARTCRLRNHICVAENDTRGIYHITAGNAGADLDEPRFYQNYQVWTAKWIGDYGFSTVTVVNETNMFVESYVVGTHDNGTNFVSLDDRLDLSKPPRETVNVDRFALFGVMGSIVLLIIVLAVIGAMLMNKRNRTSYAIV